MKKIISSFLLLIVLLASATSAFAAEPTVDLTTPYSTSSANPSVYTYQPNISWYQNDTDPNSYFSTYWLLIYDSQWNVVYNSGIVYQNNYNHNVSVYVPTYLPRNETLAVAVGVQDNTGTWDSGSYVKYLKIQQ